MKKRLKFILVLLLSISLLSISLLAGCSSGNTDKHGKNNANEIKQDPKAVADIERVIEGFGSVLQKVSLQGPAEEVKKSIQENYSAYVSPDLLERWIADPLKALGRLTSSPWPDRIEIKNVERLADEAYKVEGEIIEITSAEKENEVAAKKPVTFVLENIEGKWLIITAKADDPVEK
jgi:hypothetical protein